MEGVKMKRVFAVILLALAACSMAAASQDHWRLWIKPDDGGGLYSAGLASVGIYSDSSDSSDIQDFRFPWSTSQISLKAVSSVFDGGTWLKDIRKADSMEKTWNLRAAGLENSDTGTPVRLQFFASSADVMPPTTYNGRPVLYRLTMVDNRGVAGSPANGTVWDMPVPTVHSTSAFFSLTLPPITLTRSNDSTMISQGYALRFASIVTPEPGSLMMLGSGLIGLAGFAVRRKRS